MESSEEPCGLINKNGGIIENMEQNDKTGIKRRIDETNKVVESHHFPFQDGCNELNHKSFTLMNKSVINLQPNSSTTTDIHSHSSPPVAVGTSSHSSTLSTSNTEESSVFSSLPQYECTLAPPDFPSTAVPCMPRDPAASKATEMSFYLQKLREMVPYAKNSPKLSKVQLIHCAIDYITDLQEALEARVNKKHSAHGDSLHSRAPLAALSVAQQDNTWNSYSAGDNTVTHSRSQATQMNDVAIYREYQVLPISPPPLHSTLDRVLPGQSYLSESNGDSTIISGNVVTHQLLERKHLAAPQVKVPFKSSPDVTLNDNDSIKVSDSLGKSLCTAPKCKEAKTFNSNDDLKNLGRKKLKLSDD